MSVTSHDRSFAFGGLLLTEKEVCLVEIKYFSHPTFKKEFLEALLHRAASFLFAQMFDKGRENIAFWFVIIMDFPKKDVTTFMSQVRQSVVSDLFRVNFLFFHYDELEKKYGTRDG